MFKIILWVICIVSFCIFLLSFSDFNGKIDALHLKGNYVRVLSLLIAFFSGVMLLIPGLINSIIPEVPKDKAN